MRVYVVGGTEGVIQERNGSNTILSTVDIPSKSAHPGSIMKRDHFYMIGSSTTLNRLLKYDYNYTLLQTLNNPTPSLEKTATIPDIIYSEHYGRDIMIRDHNTSSNMVYMT